MNNEAPDIHQRIGQLVEHFCSGNKTAFGRQADILPGVLASIIGGRMSKPSFDLLQKIMNRYPSVSGDWLIMGRGPMLREENGGLIATPLSATQPLESLEAMVKQIVATQLSTGQITGHVGWMRERQLSELAERDSMLASQMSELREIGLELKSRQERGEDLGEKLDNLRREYTFVQDDSRETFLSRLRLHDLLMIDNQEAEMVVYRVHGEADASKPHGGLLQYRLGISQAAALQLIATGKIHAAEIEGEGYRISEMAVLDFLNKA